MTSRREELAAHIELACRIEATARKAGNVHPGARFDDLEYTHFLRAAELSAPHVAAAGELGVGQAVELAVQATRAELPSNANLGIVLLLAPLAAVPESQSLMQGIGSVLSNTTVDDAAAVYRAIQRAAPGGLGQAASQDVSQRPTETLTAVMSLAADRDAVARQYATSFRDVLETAVSKLRAGFSVPSGPFCDWPRWEIAVVGLQLELLALRPDTLIQRKCGLPVAEFASQLADGCLQAGWPTTRAGWDAFRTLDAWMRADGNRRNPGATADLIAAALFAALRDGALSDEQLPP